MSRALVLWHKEVDAISKENVFRGIDADFLEVSSTELLEKLDDSRLVCIVVSGLDLASAVLAKIDENLPIIVFGDSTKLESDQRIYLSQDVDSLLVLIIARQVILNSIHNNESTDWLTNMDHILEFSRNERLENEKVRKSFEKLFSFEEKLYQESIKINEALLMLQEFRDKEKAEWICEKQAREAIQNLMTEEIREKDVLLKAQENLIRYIQREKVAYGKIILELKSGKKLTRMAVIRFMRRIRKKLRLLNEIEETQDTI